MSEDSEHGNPTDPLSLNLYTYCWDNPLLYIDYTGNGPMLSHFVRLVDYVLDFYLRANSLNILNSTNVGASLLMMDADEAAFITKDMTAGRLHLDTTIFTILCSKKLQVLNLKNLISNMMEKI